MSTMFFNCIDGINEVQKEGWRIYNNENNSSEITQWHRMSALTLIKKCSDSKFNMFAYGSAYMEIYRLHGEVGKLKSNLLDDMNNANTSFSARFDNIRRTGLPHHDLFKNDNNK